MKKMKKILTALLALTMAVTMAAIQAPIMVNAETPTIDTTEDVSLTIYKYRYDGTTPGTATGEANDTIPDGAQLLNGVTFKVYKVAEIVQEDDQLKYKTLDNVKTALDAASTNYISGGMTSEEIKALFTDTVLESLKPTAIKTTATVEVSGTSTNGVAQFVSTDLDGQGLYLVVETDAPDVVTTMVDPFLVSLPMANIDGNDWLYDVYVFPKNGTTTGNVKLVKTGTVGNGSAVNVSAQFVIQKNIDGTWKTLTTNDNGEAIGTNGVITVDATNGVTVSGLSQGVYRFVEIVAPDTDYIIDGNAYEFVMDEEGEAYEYNASVTGGKGNKITNETGTVITVANYKPVVEKKVLKKGVALDSATGTDWQDAADYSVGDRVTFKVSSTVPANIALLKHYVLVDTMSSGLTMDTTDQASFVVTYYAGDTKVTDTGITAVPSYETTNNKWTLDLSAEVEKLAEKSITSIEVTFTATLENDAVTAGTGNPNTIGLEYTNKLYPDDYETTDGTPYEETNTITDKVTVYTFGIELDKTFSGATTNDNFTATFDLYRPFVTGTDDTDDKESITVGGTETDVIKIGTYTTDKDKKIIINTTQTEGTDADTAVSNGTYYFVETATASGYNLLKEPVEVNVELYYTQTFKTTKTVTQYDENGNVIGSPSVSDSGTDATTYYSEYTNADNNIPTTVTTTTIGVVNNKGFTLPSTGGVGTYIFVFVGVSMMAAAVILFITTKKKEASKN